MTSMNNSIATVGPTYVWTPFEAKFLACDPQLGMSNITFCEYLRVLDKDKTKIREAHLASLARVTEYIIASGATELTTIGSYLFGHFSKYKVWRDGFDNGLDPLHIAIFALCTVTNSYSEEPSDYDEVKGCLRQWLGIRFSFSFETRARDLSEAFFGPVWTSLFEGELRQTRTIINAVMSTRPAIVALTPAAAAEAPTAVSLPADITV